MSAGGAAKRRHVVPDVPTLIEAGLPGGEICGGWGMVVPAGVPNAIQPELAAQFTRRLNEPGTVERLEAEAADPQITTPDELRSFIAAEAKPRTEVARQAGIRVD